MTYRLYQLLVLVGSAAGALLLWSALERIGVPQHVAGYLSGIVQASATVTLLQIGAIAHAE